MEFLAIFFIAGTVGVMLYGALIGIFMAVERDKQQKKEIADLRRDNLSFSRTNAALRDLLNTEKI